MKHHEQHYARKRGRRMRRGGRGRHGYGPPFTGRGGPGRFFRRGELRLGLLDLIAEKPRHGYELIKELEERSGGGYRPSAGAIYPTLQLLEDEGLATSTKENGKTVYSATDNGRAEVERESETIERIQARAEDWKSWGPAREPGAMEIARQMEATVKAAFSAVARNGADPDAVRSILEQARSEIEALEATGGASGKGSS